MLQIRLGARSPDPLELRGLLLKEEEGGTRKEMIGEIRLGKGREGGKGRGGEKLAPV